MERWKFPRINRSSCVLYSFIRLADYLIVNTMHVLAVNSVSTLLNYLSEQLQNTPSLAEIQGWNQPKETPTEGEEKDKEEEVRDNWWQIVHMLFKFIIQVE